jgi:hypothetical protein
MRLKILYILFALCLPLCASGANGDVKLWSDGALSWNDFDGTSVLPGIQSYMKAELATSPVDISVKGHEQMRLLATASMFRNQSYADSASRTELRLRYHQLQFDLLEIYRRRLQSDLNGGMTGIEADQRVKYYQELYNEQLQTVEKETVNGTNDPKMQNWEYYARRKLDEMGLPPVPTIVPSDFSYGMYIGVGAVFPTSTIKDNFKSTFTFTAGLLGGYKRLKINADITYGQPRFKNPNIFNLVDASGRSLQSSINTYATYLSISASLGFSVVDTKRFTVTPHAGFFWSGYSWNVGNYTWGSDASGKVVQTLVNTESKSLNDFDWIAGVDFDIHVHSHVTSTPLFFSGQRERLTSTVRVTPYIARATYSKDTAHFKGYQVGFTISYAGIARALKIK